MAMDFGEQLRKVRERAGLTIGEVAKALGVTSAYVSDVERAVRKPFVPARIHAVAKLLKLSDEEHEGLLLLRGLEHGGFEIPYMDPFESRHNQVAAPLQRLWALLAPQQLDAIVSIVRGPAKSTGVLGRWIRGYSHKTRGGYYEARTRPDGDFDVREPGQEAQRVPGGYFRAEFVASSEAVEHEKTESIAAEAERLGVDFVMVDDRPIDPGHSQTLKVQATAFARVLQQGGLPVKSIKDGVVTVGVGALHTVPLASYSVDEMRAVLRAAGHGSKFLAELLKLKKSAELRNFLVGREELAKHIIHDLEG